MTGEAQGDRDRKSTRLNSSHPSISYAVFCLKKKTIQSDVPDPDRLPLDCRQEHAPPNHPAPLVVSENARTSSAHPPEPLRLPYIVFSPIRLPPRSTLFPYTTLFR